MDHSISTFLSGCAPFHNVVFFAKSLDEMEEADNPNSTFFLLHDQNLTKFPTSVGWPAVSMATVKPDGGKRAVCGLGPNGELWEGSPVDASHISGDIGIGDNSWRSLAVVGGEVFACGMDRCAAVRTGPLQWRDVSAPPAKDDKLIVGFEDLDGFSTGDMYAVGWQGEIWHRRANRWRQIDSPVSATLNAVCCAEDGVVYAVGDGGTMLRGRDDQWSEIVTGRTDNLQDVRDFNGTIYVVTDFEIFELANDTLRPVTLFSDEDDLPGTCLHLLKAADGLVSLGQKDVFKLFNGSWQRVV